MDLAEFDHNDEGYATWIRANRDGYVINCTRGQGVSDMRLHRATCETIFQVRPLGDTWTAGSYVKVCAPQRPPLESWALEKKGTRPKECQACNP